LSKTVFADWVRQNSWLSLIKMVRIGLIQYDNSHLFYNENTNYYNLFLHKWM